MRVLAVLSVLASLWQVTWATHFRYGHISYSVPDPNQPSKVAIRVDAAWRTAFIGSFTFNFGDNTDVFISSGSWTAIGTFTDENNESYTTVTTTLVHTYPSVSDYVAYFTGCCRISTLVYNSDDAFRVESTIKLTTASVSPVAQIPAIIQLNQKTVNDINLLPSIAYTGADPVTCQYNPAGGHNSQFAALPATTVAPSTSLTVTSDCRLQWDLTQYDPANDPKYAVSMLVEVAAKGVVLGLDFIIELVEPPFPLTCGITSTLLPAYAPGDDLTATFQVDDGAGPGTVGDVVLHTTGLPGGATVGPSDQSSDSLPGTWTMFYSIPEGASDFQTTLQWTLR